MQLNEVAFQTFKLKLLTSTSEINKIGVHLSHCFSDDPECFGGYECCKYGDEYCPADPQYKNELDRVIKENGNND